MRFTSPDVAPDDAERLPATGIQVVRTGSPNV
jgi:hypothetical protein